MHHSRDKMFHVFKNFAKKKTDSPGSGHVLLIVPKNDEFINARKASGRLNEWNKIAQHGHNNVICKR